MNFKLVPCPVCGSRTKLTDPEKGKFVCEMCGHNGYYQPEESVDTYAADSTVMQGLHYTVDIVMCIDATASMKHLIKEVKNNALRFYDDLKGVMELKSKVIDQLRVKVIAFRDFWADGKYALVSSEFFTLPQDRDLFSGFVSSIHASGGGNLPENGLEALATAISSDWSPHGDKRRQLIVLWTDASTHPLDAAKENKPQFYPSRMPQDMNELTDLWEDNPLLKPSSKRLILFAPDKFAWTDISNHWSNTIQYPSKAGQGLSSIDYQTILDAIANSV